MFSQSCASYCFVKKKFNMFNSCLKPLLIERFTDRVFKFLNECICVKTSLEVNILIPTKAQEIIKQLN